LHVCTGRLNFGEHADEKGECDWNRSIKNRKITAQTGVLHLAVSEAAGREKEITSTCFKV